MKIQAAKSKSKGDEEKSESTSSSGSEGPSNSERQVMVEAGDTLSSIAADLTGDWSEWEDLWQANRDQISNPNQISPGWLLKLPSDWDAGSGEAKVEAPADMKLPEGSYFSVGDKGDEVKDLQNILNQHGAGLKVDGDFGPATLAAVQNFQRNNGLPVDGIVGASTTKTLNECETSGGEPDTFITRAGDTLSSLAEMFTGVAHRWQELWSLNKGKIPDPDKVSGDVELELPIGWGGADLGPSSGGPSGGDAIAVEGGPYTEKYGEQSQGNPLLQVERGQITFDAEGKEGGRFHTRTAHWPGGASGVTIGRGYDMGSRSWTEVYNTLKGVGVSAADAEKLAAGAGLVGVAARDFVNTSGNLPEITLEAQKALFDEVYLWYLQDVVRISDRSDVVSAYGRVNWDTVDPNMVAMMVDLRYRGDYTPTSRRLVQRLFANNDVSGLSAVINDRSLWANVPDDRFERRAAWMQQAVVAHDLNIDAPEVDAGKGANTESGGSQDERANVIKQAESHLGAPYYWGADGPSSFDCSGFALYVLRNDCNLIDWGDMTAQTMSNKLPRTTNPQPGDLVFYSRGGKVGHVEIVVETPEEIGASGGGSNTKGNDPKAKVQYGNMNADSRARHYGSIEGLIQEKQAN